MPYCSQCAQALSDAAKFCPACGAAVVPPTAVPAPHAATKPAPTRAASDAPVTADLTRTSDPNAAPSLPPTSGDHGRFEPGTRLGTRWRIVGLLGRGGMGEVYRADDLELGQSVALKFLPASVANDSRELARFRNEVRVARQIAHPNVCRVYDIGEVDGHVFLSMEYIDGEDLASVLRRMGRPTEDKAVEIARQVCLGLAAAHEAGMLHRDLKPANIMIDGRGRARITDFGLAGLASELARGGQVAGTPAYMAPEQLADGTVSVRSDVYSLGLVLYELFTGKRVFEAKSIAELRQQHDSSSITSPSSLARGITPAVERLILHCLERDVDLRPPSAYAVLGALPGGDPLAAAMAAGETPSPELVANAAERGGLSPLHALALLVVLAGALAGLGAMLGPEFRPLKQPAAKLEVRAEEVLRKTGAFDELPAHTAGTFSQNDAYLEHLMKEKRARAGEYGTAFYWQRWAPRLIENPRLHAEVPNPVAPATLGNSSAIVLLDPNGRLVGLRAEPPDTVKARNGGRPDWNGWFAAFGMDSNAYTPVPLVRPVPALCDTAMAWHGPSPWTGGDTATVQMGASRGRLTHFTVVSDWGVTNTPVDELAPVTTGPFDFLLELFLDVLPYVLSVYFAWRNLKLGRGDWRGATRIAVFVFFMNIGEAVFSNRLSEVGVTGLLGDLFSGRAQGHSLIHAMGMWFAYVALEPYVRRLWPRLLVSWTRLLSGRFRDPLVGRDLLVGAALGAAVSALSIANYAIAPKLGLGWVPALASFSQFEALTPGYLSVGLCYSGSICVLNVLQALFVLLMLRLLLRHTGIALAACFTLFALSNASGAAPQIGWKLALLVGIWGSLSFVLILRVGLLATVVAAWTGLVLSYVAATLDFGSWYGGIALLPMALVFGIASWGAVNALAGKSILGDPLEEAPRAK
ncbi:MAG: serine/threonine-protein kinase [Candidatus Eisenbacteria bacterium]